jgi:hypothetical protein
MPTHATKPYRGPGGIAPLMNLSIRWRERAADSYRIGRWVSPGNRSEHFGEETDLLPLPDFEAQIFQLAAYSLYWGWQIVPCIGKAWLGRKPQPICCVSVKPWRHSNVSIWDPFSLTVRMLEVWVWGQCGTSSEGQGFHDLDPVRGHKGPVKAYVHRDRKGSTHTYPYHTHCHCIDWAITLWNNILQEDSVIFAKVYVVKKLLTQSCTGKITS